MTDYKSFNERVSRKYELLGADRLRIQRLIEKEDLPQDVTLRLTELQREIDITMTEGYN